MCCFLFTDCKTRLLKKITQFKPTGVLADLAKTVNFFKVSTFCCM